MSLLTVLLLIRAYSSAFLIDEFEFNQTSTPLRGDHASVEDSIRDLMTLIVEEKRMRFQMETRLNNAETKINQMHLYNKAVSDELAKEKNKVEQLETTCNDLRRQLNNLTSTDINNTTGPLSVNTDMVNDVPRMEENVVQLNQTLKDKFVDIDNQLLMMNQTFLSVIGESVGFSVYKPYVNKSDYAKELRFQDMIYNKNDVYNTTTGVFTCPRQGLYLFIFTVVKTGDSDKIYCGFYKNDQLPSPSATTIAEGGIDKFSSGTNSILFRLQVGDRVYIGNCNHMFNSFGWETSFMGILITPDL